MYRSAPIALDPIPASQETKIFHLVQICYRTFVAVLPPFIALEAACISSEVFLLSFEIFKKKEMTERYGTRGDNR